MPKVSFAPDEYWPVLQLNGETYNDEWDIELTDEELAAFKAAELAFAKVQIEIGKRIFGDEGLFWADDIVRKAGE